MKRCKSWKPQGVYTDYGVPGRNKKKWRVCHNKALKGFPRCMECYRLLATSPDVSLRRLLATERPLPEEILYILQNDLDIGVKRKAENGYNL